MSARPTVAQGLAAALDGRGVRRLFGVPGSGSSLDVIDAAAERGMEFILAKGETSAAIMAAVTAELSGAPGVILTGVGPGAASAVNGIAYAALERAPVVLITDCFEESPDVRSPYQRFDQEALYAPLVKAYRRLAADHGAAAVEDLLQTALDQPQGPVHIDLSARQAAAPLAETAGDPRPGGDAPPPAEADLAAARALLSVSTRPVVVAGLQARHAPAAAALGALVAALDCPVLATYKAKGVFAEDDRRWVGLFTGAAAEFDCIAAADLVVFFGLDPIELIRQPWRHSAPVLDLSPVAGQPHPVAPRAALAGPLALSVEGLAGATRQSAWTAEEMAAMKDQLRRRLAMVATDDGGRNAQAVVEAVRRRAPAGVRLSVDSGAHMFSAMAFWEARAPHDVLKSSGLSTMGFALPAAIASALHEPDRPVVAMTGDGGLMMCLAELATAVRHGLDIVVVVFNDAALSLIDIKQQRQQRRSLGVRYPAVDLAAAARGLGCRAWRVDRGAALEPVLAEAFDRPGPALVDIAVDPAGYGAQVAALRG